jgi:hypothetical protein
MEVNCCAADSAFFVMDSPEGIHDNQYFIRNTTMTNIYCNEKPIIRRNPHSQMSEADSAVVATLIGQTRAEAERRIAELCDVRRLEAKRALNAATHELLARDANFQQIAKELVDRIKPELEGLKLSGGTLEDGVFKLPENPGIIYDVSQIDTYVATRERLRLLDKLGVTPSPFQNPPFAGELWWGETHSFGSGQDLVVDIEDDPPRIWGHIAYDRDPLLNGNIGFSMFFFLTPDRFPAFSSGNFEIRPRVQISGWASGWTGFYHPVWHADDKWSKCWQTLRMSATLSSGEPLDTATLGFNLFSLEDENPVGQGNANLTMGWQPVLRFGANLTDLRARGVSIVLEAAFRYDYQLEGESDLWLRNRPGSNTESVAGFDNAVRFHVFPGNVWGI